MAITELVFILDRSGSMSGLEDETIGGFNGLIEKQKSEPGQATVTTALFDHRLEWIHKGENICYVTPLNKRVYYPTGTTALLDAVGQTILEVQQRHLEMSEHKRPSKTLVVITTDGYENASHQYNYHDVKTIIKKQKEIYDWEFLFLGANIDAGIEGVKFGIDKDRSVTYHADEKGVKKHYKELSKAMCHYRKHNKLSENWHQAIKEDFDKRS